MVRRRNFLAALGAAAAAPILNAGGKKAEPKPKAKPAGRFVWRPTAQIVGGDALAVCWRTDSPSTGTLFWTQDPALPRDQWASACRVEEGLTASNRCDHLITVRGLDFTRPFLFEAVSEPVKMDAWWTYRKGSFASGVIRLRPILRAGGFTFAMFNDVHANVALFPKLCALPAVMEAEPGFAVLNGDCAGNCASEEQMAKDILNPLADLTARGLPVLVVRGNHEYRGAMARRIREAFAPFEHGWYAAFNLGQIRLLLLDGGEDKADTHREYCGLLHCEPYIAQEAAWLAQETASPAWKAAARRVALCHIPPTANDPREDRGYGPTRLREKMEPVLCRAGLDLLLCGHTHHAALVPAEPGKRPYPTVIGGGPKDAAATVTLVQASPSGVRVSCLPLSGAAPLTVSV